MQAQRNGTNLQNSHEQREQQISIELENILSSSKRTLEASSGYTTQKLLIDDVSLLVTEGPHKGQELYLQQEIVRIGRANWCDIILSEDQWVSNVHCECWLDEKGLRVKDLRSRNGIKIEGCPVFDAYLIEGVKLQIGSSVLQLKSHKKQREIDIHFQDESGRLVGRSLGMRKIFSMLRRIGKRKVATLLTGETGTGKTSIARAIHEHSNSPKAPFVTVNCGALTANLIESALFGYVKGAFTGALKSHAGFFEQANGGTLFLDEIGELPMELQAKLLDVTERKMVRRLGSEQERKVDFHLITATNRNLPHEIDQANFREDLYFRISVIELEVPPLRERKEDIPLLVEAILQDLQPETPLYITEKAILELSEQLWPGNIRQLRNVLDRSLTFLENNIIDAKDLEYPEVKKRRQVAAKTETKSIVKKEPTGEQSLSILPAFPLAEHSPPVALKEVLADTEQVLLKQALKETDLNVPEAAKLLSISESWLYNRIKRYKLPSKKSEGK